MKCPILKAAAAQAIASALTAAMIATQGKKLVSDDELARLEKTGGDCLRDDCAWWSHSLECCALIVPGIEEGRRIARKEAA